MPKFRTHASRMYHLWYAHVSRELRVSFTHDSRMVSAQWIGFFSIFFIPARTYVNHSWYMRDLCVIHAYIYVNDTCYVCQHWTFTRYISDPSVIFTRRLRVLSAMHTWSIRGTVKSGVSSAYKYVNFTNVPRVLREWKTHDSRITRELHVFFTRFRSFEQLKTWESRKKAFHA